MPSPATFWPEALPYARAAHAGTGVLPSVILAQWAIETGFGGADWSPNNNPGNVGSFDGQPVATFPTLAEGVDAYIQTMNLGYYSAVRAATEWRTQCLALGASPWASAHYRLPGGIPGSELVYIVGQYDLTQYDGATPPPAPPPNLTEGVDMTSWQENGQNHIAGVVNGKAYHWWQTIGGNPTGPAWNVEELPTP